MEGPLAGDPWQWLGAGSVALVVIVSAAVTEEVVYRGSLVERLGALLGLRPWALWAGAAAKSSST